MSAIGKAFQSIGSGIKNTFVGMGRAIKGAFTLDLKGAAQGAKQAATGVTQVGTTLAGCSSPTAFCANQLMDAAVCRIRKQSSGGQH